MKPAFVKIRSNTLLLLGYGREIPMALIPVLNSQNALAPVFWYAVLSLR